MNTIIKYGLIAGIANVAIDMIGTLAGETASQVAGWIAFFAIIGLIVYFALQIRKQNGDQISFGKAYGALFGMSLIANLFQSVNFWITMNFLRPDVAEQIVDGMVASWEAQGMEDEMIDMLLGIFNPQSITFALFVFGAYVLGAAILYLLVAAGIKKEAPTAM